MCESTVYILRNGKEEMFFEHVDTLENDNGEITLADIFGETKKISGIIKQFSLIDHKILLEPC
ncbi:MAG: CooT family nickel-binding protein [Deltaproteobacteria bacterium]|nr:CooT family nickel-binding protein [Deltaproteobacteria bacterium]